jgi:hypothetical protein
MNRTGSIVDAPGFGFTSSSAPAKMWARTAVAVSDGDVNGVVLSLQPGLSLSGRFVAESSPNRKPSPQPLFLHVQSASGSVREGTTYNRSSGRANGDQFALTELVPGSYLFYPGTGWMLKSVIANGRDHTYTPLEVTAPVSDIVVTFTNDIATLVGKVTNAASSAEPLSVLAFPAESSQWTNYGLRAQRIKVTEVSSSGEFTFRNLPAGNYNVVAFPTSRTDAWREPGFFARAQPLSTRVDVDWGQEKSVTLTVRDGR